ncbi:MAG TPA: Uma2 family endonuclease [Blastocatellia bacterium]|nr:Uma2 family endonuclease [Blastocatellia bacterium]
MVSKPNDLLSREEYLALERNSEFKSEYFAGQVFAMAGGNRRHNLVAGNLNRILGNQLLERPCSVYNGDMRVKIASIGKYTYPDVSVACAEEQFEDAEEDTLLNPVVIIEVLSKSTEVYDRGKKWEHYQRIESLREYLLVSQAPYRIEQYVRQSDGSWSYRQYDGESQVVTLESVACSLPLAEVYAKLR